MRKRIFHSGYVTSTRKANERPCGTRERTDDESGYVLLSRSIIIIIVKEKENSDMLTGTRPLSLADAGRPVGRRRAICTRKGESQKLAAAQCGVITVARHHVKWFIYIHALSFSSFCSFRDRCSCWLFGDRGCGGRNSGVVEV